MDLSSCSHMSPNIKENIKLKYFIAVLLKLYADSEGIVSKKTHLVCVCVCSAEGC